MISVNEALALVLEHVERLGTEQIPLLESRSRVLAEDVPADMSLPPFPRSSMDGYAVRAADLAGVPARLQVMGIIPAGSFPTFKLQAGEAAKIMTGAPVPEGADAVQMIEKTRELEPGRVVEILERVVSGANVTPAGSEAKDGQIVAAVGTFISPAVIGLLATVGKNTITVYRAPTVAILATGDELVEISAQPEPGQIRNSNSFCLFSQVQQAGGVPKLLGAVKDEKSRIRAAIRDGLEREILLLTGGVSMGDLDLVKDVFGEFGFEIFFTKVAVKPGKPVVFARSGKTLVFGLPGNPASAATTFELLVRPALRKMMGFPVVHNQIVSARLTERFLNRSDREFYAPASVWYEDEGFAVRPLKSKGSGDIVTYAQSNAYLICPIERAELQEGEKVEVMLRAEFLYL